jgi:hypothetical protein
MPRAAYAGPYLCSRAVTPAARPVGRRIGCTSLAVTLLFAGCGGSAPAPPGDQSLEPARWHLEEPPRGRSVPLVYTAEECVRTPGEDTGAETAARFERAEVASSRKAVTITVLLRPPAGEEGVACGNAPISVRRTVTLPEPLGDRSLRDGGTSPPTAVRPPG